MTRSIIDDTRHLIEQNMLFLDSLSPDLYNYSSPNFQSIGTHYRHLIDFYKNILNAHLDGTGINYSNRERDSKIETDKQHTTQFLAQLGRVITMYPVDTPMIIDSPYGSIKTTFQHELLKALNHATHHNSIMKLIADKQGVGSPQYFGYDSETIRFIENK